MASAANQMRAMPFAGASPVMCYRVERDTARFLESVPSVFQLVRDANGRNIVRAVSPDARADSVVAGASWAMQPRELVVRFTMPESVQLSFAPMNANAQASTQATAQASSGAVRRDLVVRRGDCRP